MLKKIEEIFAEVTGIKNPDFTPKTKLSKLSELSSFGVVQLVCEIEDEFDVSIPNSELKKFKTVGDIIKYLEKNAR